MEFAGVEFGLLPAITQVPPTRDKTKVKDQKVWLAGELIVRCERQGITELPPQLLLKTTVRSLILTGNQLSSLPHELFQQLRELRELRLGHNQLTQLPQDVQLLQQLTVLELQHNRLQDVPSSLCRCARLTLINLDGNLLCERLKALWTDPTAAAAAAAAAARVGSTAAGTSSPDNKQACISRESAVVEVQRLKANTTEVLDHLLATQDADTIQQVQQARLAVLQQGSRVRVKQLLRVADLDSLAEAYRAATDAQLGQQVLAQVQTMQAAAEVLQGAVQQVQQQRQQQAEAAGAAAAAGGVAAVSLQKAQEQLGSALRRMEGLSKPAGGRPSGVLFTSAHDLLRALQRQQLERGWRCAAGAGSVSGSGDQREPLSSGHSAGGGSTTTTAAAAAAEMPAADGSQGSAAAAAAPPRRFLTSAERKRQQLAASGGLNHQQWAAVKQQQQQERQQAAIKDLVRAEVEGRVERVAERAAHALENCERERQWPSRRVEAYSPGTFNLSPQLLQAVRKAYHKGPAVC